MFFSRNFYKASLGTIVTLLLFGFGGAAARAQQNPQPAFSVDDVTVTEGNSGTVVATFTVTLSAAVGYQTSVNFTTSDGTATVDSDYRPLNATLNFGANATSIQIPVIVIGDTVAEANETFVVTLSNPVNSTISKAQGTATIINDDGPIITSPQVQFSAANFTYAENVTTATITVTRTGDASNTSSVEYATVDDQAVVRCDFRGPAAYARCDYATTIDTLTFAANETQKTFAVSLVDDGHTENNETLQLVLRNPSGANLGAQVNASLTITDNDSAVGPNPILQTPFFVRQMYLDFFLREPEPGGFGDWTRTLNNCSDVNNNPDCDRIRVASLFFQSQEFQFKGYYAYLFYRITLQRLPAYVEFVPDLRRVTGQTPAEVYQKKAQFANNWTQRADFRLKFDGLTSAAFVNALLQQPAYNQQPAYQLTSITTPNPATPDDTSAAAKVTLTRDQLVASLETGQLTRAQVVRAVVQSDQVYNAEYNAAFVAMQYFGFLRRDPDQGGYDDWLRTINVNREDVRRMVDGFVNSTEYRLRFGQE